MPRGGYRPNAGRPKGGTTRVKLELATLKRSLLNFDPIQAMVEIAIHPKASLELRGRMSAELANYLHPKQRAIVVNTPPGQALALQVTHVQGVDE